MQSFDIIKKSTPSNTFRVAAIKGTFDLQNEIIEERFVGQIDLDYDWQIGLIVGNSGTGKTTIAKELFPDAYITNFTYTKETVEDLYHYLASGVIKGIRESTALKIIDKFGEACAQGRIVIYDGGRKQ